MLVKTKYKSTFKVIRDSNNWEEIISQCDLVDFYHTYTYHLLSSIDGEKPILIYFGVNNKIIALPLLLRTIAHTGYFDATSVYGYPGPITKGILTAHEYELFQTLFEEYCVNEKIVSVFSRLNSFIPFQENCLRNIGNIETLGNSVYIDTSQESEVQLAQYHRRLRTYINKSRKLYDIKIGCSQADVNDFVALYHENMKRVNANPIYYFSKPYFKDLLNANEFETIMMLAFDKKSKKPAGGAIFVKHGLFVQYHLSGVKEEFLTLNPVKLMIDEMRKIAIQQGCCFFNLGGGVGGKEDSLFYFKSGYSKEFVPFKVWKFIALPKIYGLLSKNNSTDDSDFFPKYRVRRY